MIAALVELHRLALRLRARTRRQPAVRTCQATQQATMRVRFRCGQPAKWSVLGKPGGQPIDTCGLHALTVLIHGGQAVRIEGRP